MIIILASIFPDFDNVLTFSLIIGILNLKVDIYLTRATGYMSAGFPRFPVHRDHQSGT